MVQVLLLHQLASLSLSCEHGNLTGILLACELRFQERSDQECSDKKMAFSPQRSWMQHLVCAGALMSDAEGGPMSSKGAMFCAVFFFFKMHDREHIYQIWWQKAFLNKQGMRYNTKMVHLGPLQWEVPTENTRQMFQFWVSYYKHDFAWMV